jgi:hypothetical protein
MISTFIEFIKGELDKKWERNFGLLILDIDIDEFKM